MTPPFLQSELDAASQAQPPGLKPVTPGKLSKSSLYLCQSLDQVLQIASSLKTIHLLPVRWKPRARELKLPKATQLKQASRSLIPDPSALSLALE